ncbi:MAG: ATP-binding protein, partial [Burkholderiales bacterium]
LSYHKEPTDVAEVISDVVDAQHRAIDGKGLQAKMNLADGLRVFADETRLSQVFANLLQNNLRYTDTPGDIHITTRRNDKEVLVHWEDSGPGVPPDDLPRLMQRLYRVEGSRSRAGGGSGLGLAIAKAIIEGHGGRLTARASPLGGLAIDIALPAYDGNNGHG